MESVRRRRRSGYEPVKPSRTRSARRFVASHLVKLVGALTSPSATIAVGRSLGMADKSAQKPLPLVKSRNILVLRPDGIGDLVMTGPFLRELRRAAPGATITLVIAPRSVNFVETCPYVDRVLTVDIPPPKTSVETWWRPLSRRTAAMTVAFRYLRRKGYDLALVPRWGVDNHEASVLAYLSGASERVGYSEHVSSQREDRNQGYDRFFTVVIRDRSVKHEVERNLGLLAALQAKPSAQTLEAWLSSADVAFASNVLALAKADPLVAIGAGAGSPRRMWPIGRFVKVGRWVIDRGGSLVVVGGSGEEALGDELGRSVGGRVFDLTNRATLRQTTAVLKRCSMFCGNDSGPMHLAAAAGIPVLEVSCHPRGGDDLHANSPRRFGPWGVPHRILQPEMPAAGCDIECRASVPHCILEVPVASVIRAMASLLEEGYVGER
jgi:ADP-heptose:LPS heptosyltransferase